MITTAPATQTRPERLIPVNATTFRVLATTGRVLGHIAVHAGEEGSRYHARRYHVPTGTFVEQGAFWSMAEAVQCLRWL
ncbi:hypothetical protein [Microbacterium gorillae]|uniref:hypothetical protein n=1 Tax=Microbacterium gorillae TaxID=1231063 RepID=UPI00058F3720|nr:hypothetical protein [Microbacterium gorillae]